MNLADTVRTRRQAAGLSQEALAHRAGIATMTISRIERGTHSPNVGTLALVAAALGCPISDLTVARSMDAHPSGGAA